MTDKCHKPNFGALAQVLCMQDDTNAKGKHFTSFMLIKAYPLQFTAHLLAGYDIVGLWSTSSFPANTGGIYPHF